MRKKRFDSNVYDIEEIVKVSQSYEIIKEVTHGVKYLRILISFSKKIYRSDFQKERNNLKYTKTEK